MGKKNRGRQRLVRSDALIQRKAKSKNRVSGVAKVMEGKVGPCRWLHSDDWIERVVGGLRWGWGGCGCVEVEGVP